jgi:hypothetical protein
METKRSPGTPEKELKITNFEHHEIYFLNEFFFIYDLKISCKEILSLLKYYIKTHFYLTANTPNIDYKYKGDKAVLWNTGLDFYSKNDTKHWITIQRIVQNNGLLF